MHLLPSTKLKDSYITSPMSTIKTLKLKKRQHIHTVAISINVHLVIDKVRARGTKLEQKKERKKLTYNVRERHTNLLI